MSRRPEYWTGLLIVLIVAQSFSTAFFIADILADVRETGLVDWHLLPEIGATVALILGLAVEAVVLVTMLRRQARMEKSLGVAAGALSDLIAAYFRDWALTPSEEDVATFTIKGYSIAEIAELRGSAEATVKSHLNAIYRKAGVPGRGQLVSLLIEDLMRSPLVNRAAE